MSHVKAFLIITVLGLTASITACLHDADADSSAGLTESQVQQMITDAVAPLEARIAELETGLSGNVLRAPALAGQTKDGLRKDGTDVTAICSTLIYTPATFPGAMQSAACRSTTGYLAQIPITTTTETVRPTELKVYFPNADCTGQPVVHKDTVGEFGMLQGSVFSVNNGGTMQTVYVPAGSVWSAKDGEYSWESDGAGGYTCVANGNPGLHAVEAYPNDAQITGIADTYAGPIVY